MVRDLKIVPTCVFFCFNRHWSTILDMTSTCSIIAIRVSRDWQEPVQGWNAGGKVPETSIESCNCPILLSNSSHALFFLYLTVVILDRDVMRD